MCRSGCDFRRRGAQSAALRCPKALPLPQLVAAAVAQRVAAAMEADGAAAPHAPPPPPVEADAAAPGPQAAPPGAVAATKRKYQAVGIPTPEQIMQEDLMNNCGTRTVIAGVMGALRSRFSRAV